MDVSIYIRFLNRATNLYKKGDLAKAYELVKEEGRKVGGNQALIFNYEYCLASRLGDIDAAMDALREAVIEREYWYGYEYLLNDEDLAPLRGLEGFQRLAEICRSREQEAKRITRPELFVHGSSESRNPPILLALHGNGDDVDLTGGYWLPAAEKGFLVALPRSSQMTQTDDYTWRDLEKGREEVKAHLQGLFATWGRPESLVIAGYSGGARLALYSVLRRDVSPDGFILVAPWLPELDEWRGMIEGPPYRGIRGHILCGDEDKDCFEGARRVSEMLTGAGIPTEFHIMPGLDHEFPEDFPSRLWEMLASFARP
jgi:predicted esterase